MTKEQEVRFFKERPNLLAVFDDDKNGYYRDESIDWYRADKDRCTRITEEKYLKMTPEELEGKLVTGVLAEVDKTEFCDEYQKVVDAHMGEK